MIKTILSTIFAGILMLVCPVSATASQGVEIVDNSVQGVSIVYSSSILRVTGAACEVMQFYNVAGVRVMSVKVEGADKSYELSLPKGCYIVKVGKYVRKISIR